MATWDVLCGQLDAASCKPRPTVKPQSAPTLRPLLPAIASTATRPPMKMGIAEALAECCNLAYDHHALQRHDAGSSASRLSRTTARMAGSSGLWPSALMTLPMASLICSTWSSRRRIRRSSKPAAMAILQSWA